MSSISIYAVKPKQPKYVVLTTAKARIKKLYDPSNKTTYSIARYATRMVSDWPDIYLHTSETTVYTGNIDPEKMLEYSPDVDISVEPDHRYLIIALKISNSDSADHSVTARLLINGALALEKSSTIPAGTTQYMYLVHEIVGPVSIEVVAKSDTDLDVVQLTYYAIYVALGIPPGDTLKLIVKNLDLSKYINADNVEIEYESDLQVKPVAELSVSTPEASLGAEYVKFFYNDLNISLINNDVYTVWAVSTVAFGNAGLEILWRAPETPGASNPAMLYNEDSNLYLLMISIDIFIGYYKNGTDRVAVIVPVKAFDIVSARYSELQDNKLIPLGYEIAGKFLAVDYHAGPYLCLFTGYLIVIVYIYKTNREWTVTNECEIYRYRSMTSTEYPEVTVTELNREKPMAVGGNLQG